MIQQELNLNRMQRCCLKNKALAKNFKLKTMITNTQPTLFDAENSNSAKQLLADGAYNREVVRKRANEYLEKARLFAFQHLR